MTRKDFAARIYWRLKMRSLKETDELILNVFNEIRQLMVEGHTLYLPKFGTFQVKHFKSRRKRNPRTGELMIVPGRNHVVFRPAKSLRELVNGGYPA